MTNIRPGWMTALGCAVLMASAPAQAFSDGNGNGGGDQGGGSNESSSVRIDVTARIAERCGLSRTDADRGRTPDLDKAQTLVFKFGVDCNTPFRIGVSSTHGALRLTTAEGEGPIASDGFSVEKDYRVGLRVETDGDAIKTEPCSSRALVDKAGGCAFFGKTPGEGISSGRKTAIGRSGQITVDWPASDGGPRRAAGTYQDTIMIVIGARS